MATPAIYLLQDVFKDVEVFLVGNALSTGIFIKDNFIKDIFIDKSKVKGLINRIKATKALADSINCTVGRFDYALTFQNNFFSGLLLKFINAKNTIGYGDKNIFGLRRILLNKTIPFKYSNKPFCNHQVLSYALLMQEVLDEDVLQNVEINHRNYGEKTTTKQRKIFSLLKNMRLQHNKIKKIDKNIIAISPNASFGVSKAWLIEYFCEISALLLKKGYKVRIYGANNDISYNEHIIKGIENILRTGLDSNFYNLKDIAHEAKANTQKEEKLKECTKGLDILCNLENLTGKTNLQELINSISECDFYIGNDSGISHIARALNISMISIFGPMPFDWCIPWSNQEGVCEIENNSKIMYIENAIAITKMLNCQPCKKRVCPLKHHNCMKLITPDEILLLLECLISLKKETKAKFTIQTN